MTWNVINRSLFATMKFLVVIFLVLATVSNAFVPSIKSIGKIQKTDLKMMFGMFKGASSTSIPSEKKVCVITGTTSGLGKETARALLNKGDYYVICACRDVEKMNQVAAAEGFDTSRLELGSGLSFVD